MGTGIGNFLGRFKTFNGGPKLIDGGELKQFANALAGASGLVTAKAGGGQGGPVLNAAINPIAVVVTAADSVQLPQAQAGLSVTVINQTANACAVFPNGTVNLYTNALDTLALNNSSAQVLTAMSVGANNVSTFYCFAPGKWKATLDT